MGFTFNTRQHIIIANIEPFSISLDFIQKKEPLNFKSFYINRYNQILVSKHVPLHFHSISARRLIKSITLVLMNVDKFMLDYKYRLNNIDRIYPIISLSI